MRASPSAGPAWTRYLSAGPLRPATSSPPGVPTPTADRIDKQHPRSRTPSRERNNHVPLAVLLAGLTGSGKTTVAQALADRGYIRLSVDEEVHRLHGRYGVDYPEHTYFERERPVVEAIRERFIKEIEAGNDVVLDHGLWRRSDRNVWRQAARDAGGLPVVVYLPADREELCRAWPNATSARTPTR
ncbi:ATP-binding protein [Streptomyces sp. NPDC126514]|uniref:AAA family ATPase n=1 Tax=Streptomyces sp. NPDC126514 TaxID=3155210 RepID=UPI00333405A2